MSLFPQAFIDDLKAQTNIVSLITHAQSPQRRPEPFSGNGV